MTTIRQPFEFECWYPISNGITNIEREEVINWFENRGNFIRYHQSNVDDYFAEKFGLT